MTDRIRQAIEGLLTDYRTEGCPDPDCGVCKRSKAAEAFAREVLASLPTKQTKPILGQEAIVASYGLGRVVGFNFSMPNIYIEVEPYVSKVPMKFAPENVELLPLRHA